MTLFHCLLMQHLKRKICVRYMEIKSITYSRYSDVNGFYEDFEQVVGIGYSNSKYMLSRRYYKLAFLSMDAATKTKDMR